MDLITILYIFSQLIYKNDAYIALFIKYSFIEALIPMGLPADPVAVYNCKNF